MLFDKNTFIVKNKNNIIISYIMLIIMIIRIDELMWFNILYHSFTSKKRIHQLSKKRKSFTQILKANFKKHPELLHLWCHSSMIEAWKEVGSGICQQDSASLP